MAFGRGKVEPMTRRCQVTKNPCGTDTWMLGHSCQCDECQAYLAPCGACHDCLHDPSLGFANPTASRMILCPTCGNKRCPKATNHKYDCTDSNEPGQFGSNYPKVP